MGDRDNTHRMSYNKPRLLGPQETLQSLKHWQATTEVYYSRDTDFEPFFEEAMTWDPNAGNGHYGFVRVVIVAALQPSKPSCCASF